MTYPEGPTTGEIVAAAATWAATSTYDVPPPAIADLPASDRLVLFAASDALRATVVDQCGGDATTHE